MIWAVGTVGAGAVPIVAKPMAALFGKDHAPSWRDVCSGGEFFLIGMVVVIASICELLPTLFRDLPLDQRVQAIWRILGSGSIAFGLFFFYLLALVGDDPGTRGSETRLEGIFIELVSPAAWLLSSFFAVRSVRMAGGFKG